ncbi:MAG: choice-of-anchor D domain-containing protein [Ignavibacteria bacterium]|nr:choice-of-anchor D domain-containing protein [Ignavibacteria bacterium]
MFKFLPRFFAILVVFFIAVAPSLAQRWDKVVIGEPYNSNYWLDVFFLPSNPNLGWVCGYQGMVIRTVDGGNTWQGTKVNAVPDIQLESIHFPTQNVGYTSGSKSVFKTTTGGASWTEITPPNALNIWGCFFTSADTGVVLGGGCGSSQNFYRTTNGGLTWTDSLMNVTNSGLTDAILTSGDGLGYAVSSGWLWRTFNGGESWNTFMSTGEKFWHEEITHLGQSFLLPVAGQSCSGAGTGGGMKFSTNDGQDWINTNVADHMYGTFLLSESTGWACGLRSQMFYTSDYGQTWQLQNCGITTDLDDTYFINDSTGWVVGRGAIYRLAPAYRSVSKSAINFGEACYPGVVNDTIWVNSRSFNQSYATINIGGSNPEDFHILTPASGDFIAPGCDSIRIIIQFRPIIAGEKTATLFIQLTNPSVQFVIQMIGKTKQILSFTTDTLVTFKSAPVGKLSLDSLRFSNPGLDTESIVRVDRVTEANPLQMTSLVPIKMLPGSQHSLQFQVLPTDTGWITTTHVVWLGVCSKVVNVRAYGTSPIFTAPTSRIMSLSCNQYMYDTVIVSNTGNALMHIPSLSVFGPDSADFKIVGFVSGGSLPRLIEIGKSDGIIIRFGPVSAGQQKLATLRIENNDSTSVRGVKNPTDIKLIGELAGTILSVNDTLIDAGEICVGTQKTMTFAIKNIGTIPAGITKLISKERGFNYSAKIGSQVRQEDSLIVTVFFVPDREGIITDTLQLEFSPCGDKFTVPLQCTGIKTTLVTTPLSIQEQIQGGTIPTKRSCTVQSSGSAKAVISSITLSPLRTDWRLVDIPTLPVTLDSGQSLTIGVEFFAVNDTLFDGKICFASTQVCAAESCIPVKVQSIASRLGFSVNNLDFGNATCVTQSKRKSFTVKNDGTGVDSVNVILIKGTPVFRVITPQNGILEIPGGGIGTVEVEYNQISEGQATGELSIWSVKSDTVRYTLPVQGSFVRTRTAMSGQSTHRTREKCENSISDTITFHNSGLMADTLSISFAAGSAGFEISPLNTLIIPAGSSVQVYLRMIPSQFEGVGDYSQVYAFKGVCGDSFSVNTSCTIVRPMFVITPSSINFGQLLKNDTISIPVTVSNRTTLSKRLVSLHIEGGNSPNFFADTLTNPETIQPGNAWNFKVYCTGLVAGRYTGRVQVIEQSVCIDTTMIDLEVNILDELYKSRVMLDNYMVNYGDTITIPLHLDSSITLAGVNKITSEILYDNYLLSIMSVERKGISIPFIDGHGFVKVEQLSTLEDQLGSIGDVFEIKALALVSLPDTTTLTIKTFDVDSKRPTQIEKINGFLKIDVGCNPFGGLHLQPILTARILPPMPVRTAVQLELTSSDEQNVYLKLTDYMGITRYISKEYINSNTSTVSISTDNFSPGVYFLEVSSMGITTREKIIIVK